MEELSNIIESIIFASDHPVQIDHLLEVINAIDDLDSTQAQTNEEAEETGRYQREEIERALEQLTQKYQTDSHAFELRKVAKGYQLLTKRKYHIYVKQATIQNNQKRLSRAALETLSIIAYRQPVSKAELEFIRGVNCDYAVGKLLEKKLVSITGRSEAPGRPLLYGTSEEFMQYFGISDISDLPKLKEFDALEEEHLDRFRQYVEGEAQDTPTSNQEEHEASQTK